MSAGYDLEDHQLLAYLRRAVVNGARSTARHGGVIAKYAHLFRIEDTSTAEDPSIQTVDRAAIVQALRRLPRRQREVIVLRFYADLSIEETARLLNISSNAVGVYTHRALKSISTDQQEIRL